MGMGLRGNGRCAGACLEMQGTRNTYYAGACGSDLGRARRAAARVAVLSASHFDVQNVLYKTWRTVADPVAMASMSMV